LCHTHNALVGCFSHQALPEIPAGLFLFAVSLKADGLQLQAVSLLSPNFAALV